MLAERTSRAGARTWERGPGGLYLLSSFFAVGDPFPELAVGVQGSGVGQRSAPCLKAGRAAISTLLHQTLSQLFEVRSVSQVSQVGKQAPGGSATVRGPGPCSLHT